MLIQKVVRKCWTRKKLIIQFGCKSKSCAHERNYAADGVAATAAGQFSSVRKIPFEAGNKFPVNGFLEEEELVWYWTQ